MLAGIDAQLARLVRRVLIAGAMAFNVVQTYTMLRSFAREGCARISRAVNKFVLDDLICVRDLLCGR